jgi:xanthine dehydrogenase YagR molybdenum-binding subunit
MPKKLIKVPKVVNGVPTEVEIEVDDDGTGPTWGSNDGHRLLNSRLPRADGPAKTTGTAIYTYDVKLPGMAHGRFVTSPHAHAKVTAIDTSAAEKVPGVLAVLPIATGKTVRFAGEAVAAVAAETVEAAEDGARAVVVAYEVLPAVVSADAAMKPGAPKVFPDGGRAGRAQGNAAAVDDVLATAVAVVEAEYRTPILHHCCLESHGVTVDFRGGDKATVYCSTQGTFSIPGDSAKALGLDESDVTGIVQYMGGGFGSKFGPGVTGMWGCKLSKQLGRPVKMMLTRTDEFLIAGNGPGSIQRFKAGVDKDGNLIACHAEQFGLSGVGGGNIGAQPYQYGRRRDDNGHKIRGFDDTHVYQTFATVHTNEDSSVAMRAPGFPQASFAMESLMDELAEKIGMDPVDFRKRNANAQVAHGRQLDKGAQVIGWHRRNPKAGVDAGPVKRGFGCGIGAWGGGGRAQCEVAVTIGRDGAVTAACGTQDLGTGTRTYVRAIVAEELGLGMADVLEKIGSTKLGNANASGGSTTAASLAPAVKDGAVNARVEMAKRVAPLLGLDDPAKVKFTNGTLTGGGKTLTWKQACAALPAAGITAHGIWKVGLSGNGAHGASFAEVEVDTETGHVKVVRMCHVQDGGLILNRLATESQINGGMIQSIGMALYEGRVMDERLGLMVNPGFGDYKLSGALEIGELIAVIDDGDPRQAVIGIAEPANIPGVGAVANAVYNACGVRVRDLPITPDKILMGLMAKA